jgi:predicted ATPase
MIRKVAIRRFKRFDEVAFELRGHIVLAGPNNCGKTTLLQAVAACGLALYQWKTLNDYHRRRGVYPWKPIARQAFTAVPLRSFDLLWTTRKYREPIEIAIEYDNGQLLEMEFRRDSTEQISVRPMNDLDPAAIKSFNLPTTFVPPMSGLETDEPVYRPAKQDDLLGKGKPGDVLRNLLVTAHESEQAWAPLCESIHRLFGYELLVPNADGAHILAEYRLQAGASPLDIASGGSGFQQVLMLLAFLYARPSSIFLLDEPDAHLDVLLQETIYRELRSLAALANSQLIIATHSEVIINLAAPEELCTMKLDVIEKAFNL